MNHKSYSLISLQTTTTRTLDGQMQAAYATTHIESLCNLDIDSKPYVHRMSGIICTIGKSELIFQRK